MKNLVLAVDDDVLDDVRKYATNRATTVNAIAWEHLTRIAMEEDKAACTHESLAGLGRPSPVEVGTITWKRGDFYGR